MWLLAQNINCTQLMAEAEKFMNYDAFSASSDFLQIPLKLLINILSNDNFNVQSEEEVVSFVKKWVEFDSHREEFIPQLLDVIRLTQLPVASLRELENWVPGEFSLTKIVQNFLLFC